jgi:hypothetical protein
LIIRTLFGEDYTSVRQEWLHTVFNL